MISVGNLLDKILGPQYAHYGIMLMGFGSLTGMVIGAVHTMWHGGNIDLNAYGMGSAAIIVATGGALGMGVKKDAS